MGRKEPSSKVLVGLIAAQAVAALADGVAFYPVAEASSWTRRPRQRLNAEMDRIGCPPALRKVIPIVKVSSVAGLLLGPRRPGLARLTASAVVAYFVVALGFHAKAKDPVDKFVPAAFMLGWSVLALRAVGRS